MLHCQSISSAGQFSYNKAERILTALSVKDDCVRVERYKVMDLAESLLDYANEFRLRRAVKLVLG